MCHPCQKEFVFGQFMAQNRRIIAERWEPVSLSCSISSPMPRNSITKTTLQARHISKHAKKSCTSCT